MMQQSAMLALCIGAARALVPPSHAAARRMTTRVSAADDAYIRRAELSEDNRGDAAGRHADMQQR